MVKRNAAIAAMVMFGGIGWAIAISQRQTLPRPVSPVADTAMNCFNGTGDVSKCTVTCPVGYEAVYRPNLTAACASYVVEPVR
jgi:hypothetical protein